MAPPEDETAQNRTAETKSGPLISRRDASLLSVASIIAGLSSLLAMFVVARTVTASQYADFLLFWACIFVVFGMINGIQNESTRAASYASLKGSSSDHKDANVLLVALVTGLSVAGLIVLITWVAVTAGASDELVHPLLIVAFAAAVFSGQAAIAGSAAGTGNWLVASGILSGDAIIRTAAVTVVALISGDLFSIEVAVAAGVVTWLVMLAVWPPTRAVARQYADVGMSRLARNFVLSMLSSTATAVLVVGFPILMRVSSTSEEYATLGALLLTVSLTRAPIMMPLFAFQGVALKYFVESAQASRRRYLIPVLIILGVGIIGGVAAFFVGPWVLQLFNPEFILPQWAYFGLTFDAAIFAVLTVTGMANLARNQHVVFAVGWVVATLVTVAFLFVPLDGTTRSVLALLIGPLVGMLIHFLALIGPHHSSVKLW